MSKMRTLRRYLLVRLMVLLVGGASVWQIAALRAAAQDAKRSPNFIIVMADDLGYGDLSVYDGWIETPHLDRMAAEGLRFTDFHSSGAVCSPTRAGLMTGRYQQRAGIPGVVFANPEREEHDDGLQPALAPRQR